MIGVYIAVGISFIFAQIFAMLRYKGREHLSFIFKVLSSIGFLSIAVLGHQFSKTPSYFSIMMIALVLGLWGDVFLGLKNIVPGKKKTMVSIGIMAFLLGHLAYSINFLYHSGTPWWIFVMNLGIAVAIMGITRLLKYKLSLAYQVLGYFYSFIISLMMTSAIYFAIKNLDNIGGVLVLIGAISFFVSDSLLSASYFKSEMNNKTRVNYIVHQTYFPAQILLALSIAFI